MLMPPQARNSGPCYYLLRSVKGSALKKCETSFHSALIEIIFRVSAMANGEAVELQCRTRRGHPARSRQYFSLPRANEHAEEPETFYPGVI
jgi:hypothetical protein